MGARVTLKTPRMWKGVSLSQLVLVKCKCSTSWGQFYLRFYLQLLRPQIPKAQKLLELTDFFVLLGSASVKAASEHVDEIDPRELICRLMCCGTLQLITASKCSERERPFQ